MKSGARLCALAGVLCFFTAPVSAGDTAESAQAQLSAIKAYQDTDQKLQNVGWALIRGNAEFCTSAAPSIGLQLHDMAGYGAPDDVRAALELKGDFAVQTAALGSPAGLSGVFEPNREIVSVGAEKPMTWAAEERLDWRRLTRLHDYIDTVLAEQGGVTVGFRDGSTAALAGVAACRTRFELAPTGNRAVAEGKRVVIGREFEGFGYPEELLAAVVAHELAHNLMEHRAWLTRNKRTRRNVKATEREADRLMPWLLINAGYDPRAALRFFDRYRPSSGGLLFIPGTHDKWQDRMDRVAKELARIESIRRDDGKADWALHFKRQIDPDKGL